jgi:hypothetical protein
LTLNVLLETFKYVVASFFTFGSPTTTSIPGGIEIGVRPSFEHCAVVAEKGRVPFGGCCVCAAVWKAGTRKPGRVIAGWEAVACRSRLGRTRRGGRASIVGGARGKGGGAPWW